MSKDIVVYGLVEFTNGVWAVYVPDVDGLMGRGATRDLALLNAEMQLHRSLANEPQARRRKNLRTTTQFLSDDAVKYALGLGLEVVVIRL